MTRANLGLRRLIKYVVLLTAGVYAAAVSNGYQAVVDGDTIKAGRQTVRMDGIDAPELKQTCLCNGKKVECGAQAKKALRDFIGSATVLCETRGRDLYGRLIGECFIRTDGEKNSLNEMMIRNGFAVAKYSDRFLIQESEAVKNKRGFWACEVFEDPAFFRKTD